MWKCLPSLAGNIMSHTQQPSHAKRRFLREYFKSKMHNTRARALFLQSFFIAKSGRGCILNSLSITLLESIFSLNN